MTRREVQYTGDQKVFAIALNGCEFTGILNRKSDGGCDLYLRLSDSAFDGITVDKITEIRRRAEQRKEIYVADLPGSILNPLTEWRARGTLRDWLHDSFGLEYNLRDRLKEWVWTLARFLDHG